MKISEIKRYLQSLSPPMMSSKVTQMEIVQQLVRDLQVVDIPKMI